MTERQFSFQDTQSKTFRIFNTDKIRVLICGVLHLHRLLLIDFSKLSCNLWLWRKQRHTGFSQYNPVTNLKMEAAMINTKKINITRQNKVKPKTSEMRNKCFQ